LEDSNSPTAYEPKPDDSRLSRRMWIAIILLVLGMIAVLIVGYMTFSRYVDFVK
jgi:Co/Zn/Cd efflux system component